MLDQIIKISKVYTVTPSDCKYIEIRKFEFVPKTEFLLNPFLRGHNNKFLKKNRSKGTEYLQQTQIF